MIRLLWDKLYGFLFDPKVAAVSLRSFLSFFAIAGGLVVASASDATGGVNVELIKSWDAKAWTIRLGVAFVTAAIFRIRGGDKNPTPEKLAQMVEQGKKSLALKQSTKPSL